ncbi:hypothetical protein [Allorhizocola rhizosphaerae]|uniref:hypothetical protein n=1 Tax=Allorhizocola rhizosphaerae TaxID=1872709 RepID=UPI0013C31523|nr:hypothetical protein [Allorhizocola rhizosphaerae]
MTDHEDHLDRETAERLLDGAASSRGTGPVVNHAAGPLADLLASAAAPARPHELSNEDNAVLAFRAAVGLAYPRPAKWRRMFTFKVVAAVLAAFTVGGLAFASSTGIIPAPFETNRVPAPSTTTTTPGPRPTTTTAAPTPAPSSAITDEEVRGLCNAYLERPSEERGRALQSPAFRRLVEAAGGTENVPGMCAQPGPGGGGEGNKPDKSHPAKPSKPAAAEPGQAPATEHGRAPLTGRPDAR